MLPWKRGWSRWRRGCVCVYVGVCACVLINRCLIWNSLWTWPNRPREFVYHKWKRFCKVGSLIIKWSTDSTQNGRIFRCKESRISLYFIPLMVVYFVCLLSTLVKSSGLFSHRLWQLWWVVGKEEGKRISLGLKQVHSWRGGTSEHGTFWTGVEVGVFTRTNPMIIRVRGTDTNQVVPVYWVRTSCTFFRLMELRWYDTPSGSMCLSSTHPRDP